MQLPPPITRTVSRCAAPIGGALPFILLLMVLLSAAPCAAVDVVELLSGARVEGRVTQIDKEGRTVAFEAVISGRKYERVYPYSRIHAVTLQGKRYVINEKDAAGAPDGRGTTGSGGTTGTAGGNPGGAASGRKTRAEVQALIDRAGRTPPDWFDSTPLEYPPTLDLSWPEPAPGGWNAQRNVGQYLWDIVNPNPRKWREGAKLMHHILNVNQDKPDVQARAMVDLGRMYHDLLEDYPRAAYWWQRAGVHQGNVRGAAGAKLAKCYFRLGSKEMAVELLNKLAPNYHTIKVWGEIGEPLRAVQLAELFSRAQGGRADIAYLNAGDACRSAGLYPRAIECYQRVLATPLNDQTRRSHQRARANVDAIQMFELCDPRRVPDGTYRASAPAYAGDLEVEVEVRRGRIEAVRVTRHSEKQFYSAISDTAAQIIEKQGLKGVDATASATITSEAIINATAAALARAAQ